MYEWPLLQPRNLLPTCCLLVHVLAPMTFAIILIALIKNGHHDAATWSAISQQLQVTHWPLVLQTDSAAGNLFGRRIEWKVFSLSAVGLLGTASLIAASFLTPKPLVGSTQPATQSTTEHFQYAPGTKMTLVCCDMC
jgi:hypothetical protein